MWEGKSKLIFDGKNPQGRSVFYNPKMSLNRDLAVLFALSYFDSGRISVCDAMTASGVRAIRYMLECSNVKRVEALDVDSGAVEFARRMVQLNHAAEGVSVFEDDAKRFLLNHEARFDLVDLDPFGSPVSFYESALRGVLDAGVLAATATDMAPLTGTRASACFRKYNIIPVRTDFEKEIAVRILAASLALAAHRIGMGVRVVFSHASDHYARIYVQVKKGTKAANQSVKHLGFIEYCPRCLRRESCRMLEELHLSCENCGGMSRFGGLMWLGDLWDEACVRKMGDRIGVVLSKRLSELQKLIGQIYEEVLAPPFYYRIDLIASSLNINPPRINSLTGALRELGYVATRTHFNPNAIRTDAPINKLRSEVARLVNESKPKQV